MKGDRKYKIALLAIILCTLCFIGTGFKKELNDNYGTFVMAMGMCLGLYGGANIANKHVLARAGALPSQIRKPEDDEEEEEETGNQPAP